MEILVLSDIAVEHALSVSQAIEVNYQAFLSTNKDVPLRHLIPCAPYTGVTLFKPGRVEDKIGIKIVSVRPDNAKKDLPTVPATVLVIDPETGIVRSVMNGTYLTALRTAAGSAVATRALSLQNPCSLCVFGAGFQAKTHIQCLLAVCPTITQVYVINRTISKAEVLCSLFAQEYPNVTFSVAHFDQASNEMRFAVESADIIVTATNSNVPLFPGEWVKDGAHINAIGAYTPAMRELDNSLAARSQFILDTEAAITCGELATPLQQGFITEKSHVVGTLGQFLRGEVGLINPENSQNRITVFKSVGTAEQDILTAAAVYTSALEKGIGSRVEM